MIGGGRGGAKSTGDRRGKIGRWVFLKGGKWEK